MNWDDLKVALAIGRAGSLTRAAELLAVDQSTTTRRLAALEAALGTTLFMRSKSGLTPTDAGDAALMRAGTIEQGVEQLVEHVTTAAGTPAGIVRLLGNPWVFERLAATALRAFMDDHPKLDLRMISFSPRFPVRRGATVSLWFEAAQREMEFSVKLGAVPYAVYAARGVDPATLGWVSYFDEDAPRLAPNRTLERLRGPEEPIRLTATDARILVSAIADGVGKGLLPMCLAETQPSIVRIGNGAPELSRVLHLHLHPDTVQTARVQAVVRWLRVSFESVFVPPQAAIELEPG